MKLLKEYICEALSMYMCEGFDIDVTNRIVSFNPAHQDNIDSNDLINPFVILNDDKNRQYIYSLFERKDNEDESNGNPIVYALKGLKNWTFNNPKFDIMALMKRFVRVINKLHEPFDTLLIVPSQNDLNRKVFKYLTRLIIFEESFEEFFEKIPLSEIEEFHDWDFVANWAKEHNESTAVVWKHIKSAFNNMRKNNSGIFSYKYIVPVEYRNVITTAIQLHPVVEDLEKYAPYINDKDVLIFDDTVASGKTLSDTAEAVRQTYSPRSITFLTLFSPRSSEKYPNVRIKL